MPSARFGDRVVRIFSESIRLVVAAERGTAGAWDRAWAALPAALIGGLRDRGHARLLVRACRRAMAMARLRDMGADDEAVALEAEGRIEAG